ncbi:hypothetical protein D3C78_924880 [compost metagenome]
MYAGIGGVRRQQQLSLHTRAANAKNKLMIGGLMNFMNASANTALKLLRNCMSNDAVECHECICPFFTNQYFSIMP